MLQQDPSASRMCPGCPHHTTGVSLAGPSCSATPVPAVTQQHPGSWVWARLGCLWSIPGALVMVRGAPTPATTPAPLQLGGSSLPALELPGASLGMGMNGLRDFWCFGQGCPEQLWPHSSIPISPDLKGAGGRLWLLVARWGQSSCARHPLETLHWKPCTGNTALENKACTGKHLTGKLHTNTEFYGSSTPPLPPPQPFPGSSQGWLHVSYPFPQDLSQC